MEDYAGTASGLLAVYVHLVPELHPGHGKDGPSIGRGQTELVLLVVFQQPQAYCEAGGESERGLRLNGRKDKGGSLHN